MEMVPCYTRMEIFIEDNGSWAKNKAEDYKSINKEVSSTKVNGSTTNNMEVAN